MLKGKLRSLVKVSVLVLGLTIVAAASVFADDDCDDDMPKLRRGVEAGAAKAQYSLGYCYFLGKGVQQDDSGAVKWFRKSAEQGFARGQGALGWMYEHGRGVPQDYREAVAWYRKAAEQGDVKAQDGLGRMYYTGRGVPKDGREAATWFSKAAEQGSAYAHYMLGYLYQFGAPGVPQDLREAIDWYRKTVDLGYEDAETKLEMAEEMLREKAEFRRWISCLERCEADLQNCLAMAIRDNEYNCYRAKDHCKKSCN